MVGIALIVAGQNAEDVVVGPKNVQVDQRLNERLQLVVSEDRQVVSSDRFAWPSLATFDVWRVKMLFRDIPLEEKSSSILAVTLRFCHFPVVGEYQPNNKRNGVMGAGCQGRALLPECAEAVPLAASMGRRAETTHTPSAGPAVNSPLTPKTRSAIRFRPVPVEESTRGPAKDRGLRISRVMASCAT